VVYRLRVHFVYESIANDITFGILRFNQLLRIVNISNPVTSQAYGLSRLNRFHFLVFIGFFIRDFLSI